MTLRRFVFWCHLACGVFAGLVIFIMSITGALLAYEKQIVLWADTRGFDVAAPASGAPRLPLEALVARAQDAEPETVFTGITVRAGASTPVALAAGQRIVYVDPYDGRILGQASPGVRRFFRVVTDWHRTLALTGDQRAVGKAITGACNLAFLFIVCSGLYLWWPKTWTRGQLRNITLFNGGLRGKARDFNWHNTIGFWSAVPLFVVVLGATVISYPWASDLPYRIVGEEPPPRARPPAVRKHRPQPEEASAAARAAASGGSRRWPGSMRRGRRPSSRWQDGGRSTSASRPVRTRRSCSRSTGDTRGSRRNAAR